MTVTFWLCQFTQRSLCLDAATFNAQPARNVKMLFRGLRKQAKWQVLPSLLQQWASTVGCSLGLTPIGTSTTVRTLRLLADT